MALVSEHNKKLKTSPLYGDLHEFWQMIHNRMTVRAPAGAESY